jgi:hypothetical protein
MLPVLRTVRQIVAGRASKTDSGALQSRASAAFGCDPRSSRKKLLRGLGVTQR